jgi:hypothetical protein
MSSAIPSGKKQMSDKLGLEEPNTASTSNESAGATSVSSTFVTPASANSSKGNSLASTGSTRQFFASVPKKDESDFVDWHDTTCSVGEFFLFIFEVFFF